MFGSLYHALIYQPLYNGLVFLLDTVSFADAGVAVVILTICIKVILFPLSKKAIVTQIAMKEVQPEIDRIKGKFKDDKQEQAKKIMDLYKERGVNPFSSILLIIIQIPILFALYRVFNSGLPTINSSELYSFIGVPGHVSTIFLGWFDISHTKNIYLALMVGVTQFFQAWFMFAGKTPEPATTGGSFETDFAKNMSLQTKYVLPVVISVISYGLTGALAVYWITSNLFGIGQETGVERAMHGGG